ncbi:MAG: hypothetical protein ACKVT2_02535 [Saprospiraceae bacterium]
MIRFFCTLFSGISFLLLFGNLQCHEDDRVVVYYQLLDWQTSLLDNSGREPLVAESPIPRSAFGLRFSNKLSSDGRDTLLFSSLEDYYLVALHPLRRIEMFSTDGFDTIAAGENISDRFRVRFSAFPYLGYYSLDGADRAYNLPPNTLDGDYQIDLLMIDPPSQAGAYRFSVKITFDSLAAPINRDTTFTLPTVLLQ